jgi:radical SAM superfamily enzyme YgiQ (UPF0313 family)
MNIALLDIKKNGDNKDYNGGFGTTFQIGSSFKSKILSFVRSNLENFPTMSYAYVAGIFKQNNHSVKYYVNKIPNSADLVLIHVSLIRHKEELAYIKKMKQQDMKIGVYGPLATVKPELFKEVDFIIQGEPEQVILKISKSNKIPKGKVKSEPIMDLDSLPFPDWDIFPVRQYSFSPTLPLKPFIFILASRGCPYGCTYCPYKVFGTYRARNSEKVIKELKWLKQKYKIKAFYFRDPTFSINPERIKELANLMLKNRLNLRWGCETRLDLLDIDLLKLLHKAGLRAIKVGVESLDHRLLKKHKRVPPNIKHQEKIINFCKKIGIKVIAFYIIGLPTDTKESIKKTIKYSKKLNTSFANFNICTPIPGTGFYDELKDKIYETRLNKFDNFHSVFKHDKLTRKEMLKFQEDAITSYYFRIKYIGRYLMDKLKVR